ncbi:MAG: hypothetical protein ABJL57_03025 [Hyphomonas sp.]|uniref:hypothetical protein n=2 Tax=Hyphomonas sp. TaxID=87 RepID=UPI0032635782
MQGSRVARVFGIAQRESAFFWILTLGFVTYLARALDWFSAMPGDLGDSRFNAVILEHLYRWATGKADYFWSPDFMYPFKGVLAFSDNHFGSGPVYVLLRLVGFDRYGAFQGWFLTAHVTSLASAYYALRRWKYAPMEAAFGAFVFAFALTILAKAGHSQLLYRFPIPLALLSAWQALACGKTEKLGWTAIWTAWQFLCSIYLGVFLVMLLGAFGATVLIARRGRPMPEALQRFATLDRATVAKLAAALVVSASAVGILLWNYARIQNLYGFERHYGEVFAMLPRIQSYLIADKSVIWHSMSASLGESLTYRNEHQMFFGAIAIGLGAMGFISNLHESPRTQLVRYLSITLAILVVITLAIGSVSLYRSLTYLPGFGAIRAVSRITVVLLLPMAVLASEGIWRLREWGRIPDTVLAIGVGIAFLFETQSYQPVLTPLSEWKARVDAIESQVAGQDVTGRLLYVTQTLQTGDPGVFTEADAMMAAQEIGIPTLNGYSGNFPPGYVAPATCTSPMVVLRDAQPYLRDPDDTLAEINARILTVALDPCLAKGEQLIAGGRLDQAISAGMRLTVAQGASADRFSVELHNGSDQPLVTASSTGTPVRLSWRVVGAPGNPDPSWDARKELGFTIHPGDSVTVEFQPELPAEPGQYVLEASLVQEGEFWFFDGGTPIAQLPIEVR